MSSHTSQWWDSDLALDIHECLKQRENATRNLHGVSDLMYLRRYLVDWMALTCQKFRLTANSQHLAVTLYDHFTDLYSVSMEDLKVLVICCLQVASKFEEREERIPKFNHLMDYLQWELKASDYLHMELKLLSAFDWNIGFSTASHFKEFYMQVALSARDLHVGRPLGHNREEIHMYIEKNVNYFLEVSLQDPAFLGFKPSLVAAACFASARICLSISPTWTAELRQQTNFSWADLSPCIEIMLRLHDEDRKATQEMGKSNAFPSNQYQAPLNSTGNTPIASPAVLSEFDEGNVSRQPRYGYQPPQHPNHGYLTKRV